MWYLIWLIGLPAAIFFTVKCAQRLERQESADQSKKS